LLTRPRPDEELRGLVYALTPRPRDHEHNFWQRPLTLGLIVLAMTALLNFVFL
jgi:SSS family solute:Na+ symporter